MKWWSSLFLVILLMLTACFLKNEKNNFSHANVFLYAEGNGGDYAGAMLIKHKLKDESIFVVNSVDVLSKMLNRTNSKTVLYLIGQGACNNFIGHENYFGLNKSHKIRCYSHIADKNILQFARSERNDLASNVIFFFNESQAKRLLRANPKLQVQASSRILKTVDYDDTHVIGQYKNDEDVVRSLLSQDTFLIGGNYKDDKFENFIIPLKNYVSFITKKANRKHPISIVLHPRFFNEITDIKDKVIKLRDFKKLLGNAGIKSTVYISKSLFDGANEFSTLASIAPSFNSILYAIQNTEINSKIFATADQSNISADDIKDKIEIDTLSNDINHRGIIEDRKNGTDSVTDMIIKDIALN